MKRHIVRLAVGAVAAQVHGLREDRLRALVLDVFRDVDEHRPRAPRLRDVESFLHDARNLVDVPNEVTVLHDRQRHAKEIGFLERTAPDHFLRHLTGDRHHRDRIHERIRDARDEIRRPRTRSCHANACFAGSPRIALGGEHPALLVARQNRADFFRLRERLVDRHRRPARIRKNDIHSFTLEARNQDFSAVHHLPTLGKCSRFRR